MKSKPRQWLKGMIAQHPPEIVRPFSKEVRGKLYPNGEVVIYRQKKFKPKPPVKPRGVNTEGLFFWMNHAFGTTLGMACAWVGAMGSSHLTNFDKPSELDGERQARDGESPVRYGLRGITSHGARRVRCGCHLLEQEFGKHRIVFATATVPPLPIETMGRIHKSWHRAIDAYRRQIARALKADNLSGEIITVTEVQEKRYKNSGIPVLHIHSVFVGKNRCGHWVISPKLHDDIWRRSLGIAAGADIGEVGSACNLQRVRKSTEGYLGKYMTKGTKVVRKMVMDGFDGWLPKQWWSCSRSISKRIDEQTRDVSDIAEWLNAVADIEGGGFWIWKHDVFLEFDDGTKFRIARYGRLNKRLTAEIQAALPPVIMRDMSY